jgi:hypothetical protein
MKGFISTHNAEFNRTEKQNLIRLAYSILFLMSYLAVRGIINFSHFFTVSPYPQNHKSFN